MALPVAIMVTLVATVLVLLAMRLSSEQRPMLTLREGPHPNPTPPHPRTVRAKAYVHIGPHKTGTTSFQLWLAEHRGLGDLLLPGVTAGASHTKDFAFQCAIPLCKPRQGAGAPKQRCPLLKNTSSEGRNIIVSSEEFDNCRAPGLQDLRELLKDYEVEVIAVHRLYSDHLASYYQEVAKTQAALATRGFRDWLASLGFTNLCMFVSTRCIELLASVFGASRVHIVSYDGAMAAGRSLLDVVACDVAKLACRDGELVGSHPKPVKRVKTQKTVMSLKDETTQKKTFCECVAATRSVQRQHPVQSGGAAFAMRSPHASLKRICA